MSLVSEAREALRVKPRWSLTSAVAVTLALTLVASTSALGAARPLPIGQPGNTPAQQADDPIADLADELFYDVDAIFRFVADEIAYEPYPGVLRGSQGTLAARAGNSVDKALLLAALLDASLVPYRFVSGPLDPAAAESILASTIIDSASARARADEVLLDAPAEGSASVTVPPVPPEAEAFASGLEADGARVAEVAGSQLDRSVAAIESALQAAGVVLPEAVPALPVLELAEHTWVQIASGSDWLDLDPTLPGAAPGTTAARVETTLDELPDELRYRIAIAAVLETVRGSRLTHDTIVEFEGYADAMTGLPVTFAHMKPDGMEAMGITIGRLLGDAQVEYDAVLAVGTATLVGSSPVAFATTGSDLFGEEAETTAPGQGEAIAEWLEVRVTGPDGAISTSRRTVFDRLDPAVRAEVGRPPSAGSDASLAEPGPEGGPLDLSVVPPIELVDIDDAMTDEYPPMRSVHSFAVATGPTDLEALLELPVGTENIGLLTSVGRAYHWLRDALAVEVGHGRGIRPFVAGPNIISWSFSVEAQPNAEPVTTLRLDIWHRDLRALALADATTASHPAIIAGVLSHVTERVAMRDGFAPLGPDTPPAIGVGTITDAASDEGIKLVVVRDPEALTVDPGPEARGRMAAAITAGEVVVAPERPVTIGGRDRYGWWRVDPATGRTIDEMPDGAGTEGTEYQIPLNNSFRVGMCFLALSEKIVALIALAAKALGADTTALALGAVAVGLWGANFFNPGWARTCRGG